MHHETDHVTSARRRAVVLGIGREVRAAMQHSRCRAKASVLLIFLLVATIVPFVLSAPACAQIGSERYSSLVMEARSGTILSAVDPDEPRYPASLTKMMTLYMLFEALRDRRISLDELVPVSLHAASMSPTKLGLLPATRITVEQAILGLVTLSANDAAAALGEMLGGDEDRFAQMMTMRARALGMSNTTFRNASGLPDPDQISTAHDMAILARHLIADFPQDYHYFSTPSFTFGRRVILNHDHMLQTYPGADGLKTGYTKASGLNLVTSAVRGDVRLIGVVFGAANGAERDYHMSSLLDAGFEQMQVPIQPRREMMAHAGSSTSTTSQLGTPHAANMLTSMTLPLPAPPPRVAELARPRPTAPVVHWWVWLGAYANEGLAKRAALTGRRGAEAGEARIDPVAERGRVRSWRVTLTGLSQAEAQAACGAAVRQHLPCSIERAEGGQIASR